MKSAMRNFLRRIKSAGVRRPERIAVKSMGQTRTFEAYDIGHDTFIIEKGIASHLDEHPSMLIADKTALRRKTTRGCVMTLSTGNHAVAAFPLLDGRFWGLSSLPENLRSETLAHSVICANVVNGAIEISQREVPTDLLVCADCWLQDEVGLSMRDVVMADRNEETLEYYRWLGQEWRVKPLAWTTTEMGVALSAARKRISSQIRYYHSARGVHFLPYPDFTRFMLLAESDPDAFVAGLKELVGVYEGDETSLARMDKYRGHHEIEFFGMARGVAVERLVPMLESLLAEISAGKIGQLGVIQKTHEIVSCFQSLLTNPDLADENSKTFVETLYMCITGEVYSLIGEGATPAFDYRRTALPGATFVDGKPELHPGADVRTEVLLENLRSFMSKDEVIEFANIYELRTNDEAVKLGNGATREIVYKTSRRPLENSLVEKRLSGNTRGYCSYVLSRIGALRCLGVSLSDFYVMLKCRTGAGGGRACDHYIRRRCEGDPMDSIPASYFHRTDNPELQDEDAIAELAVQMGDAAAQNMAMKKYDPKTESPLYDIGKEIYCFEYDTLRERVLPKHVSVCSVRGSFGWPVLEYSDENFANLANFYLGHFAHALRRYQKRHDTVPMETLAGKFMDGFEFRTRAMAWQLSVMRDRFEDFRPDIPQRYNFNRRWRFVMWSLDRQSRSLGMLRQMFMNKVRACEPEPPEGDRHASAAALI